MRRAVYLIAIAFFMTVTASAKEVLYGFEVTGVVSPGQTPILSSGGIILQLLAPEDDPVLAPNGPKIDGKSLFTRGYRSELRTILLQKTGGRYSYEGSNWLYSTAEWPGGKLVQTSADLSFLTWADYNKSGFEVLGGGRYVPGNASQFGGVPHGWLTLRFDDNSYTFFCVRRADVSKIPFLRSAPPFPNLLQTWEDEIYGEIYDPLHGDIMSGVLPGTPFEDLPGDWVSPEFELSKKDFHPVP